MTASYLTAVHENPDIAKALEAIVVISDDENVKDSQ